jgi:hypothetical protein
MSVRKFFLLSLSLAIFAVVLQLTAMLQTALGLRIRVSTTAPESYRIAAKTMASGYSSRGAMLGYLGLGFALASVGCLIASVRRNEPAHRVVAFGMLICYVMLQFVLI